MQKSETNCLENIEVLTLLDNTQGERIWSSLGWASVNNSYSLLQVREQREKNHSYNEGCEDNFREDCSYLTFAFYFTYIYIQILPACPCNQHHEPYSIHCLDFMNYICKIFPILSLYSLYKLYNVCIVLYTFMRYMYIYLLYMYSYVKNLRS
jgi:hypothetical protein